MWCVQSVSVHIAVLAVGKDAAPTQAVTELATKAGHAVLGRATVSDTANAIRGQLARWIDDPNIDVVIVSGGIESDNTSSALKPFVTQTLPGFTDLFRYLAFQEIGASAMLSNAEAAQCGSTFVFVLPASEGAVRAAMQKLILPQLDPNTTPKNLVSSMPRLREGNDAVPVAVVMEKTAGGSGLTPKAPALPALRERPRTGANVITRKPDDPPTKPIDVAKLERQIALSESSHQLTKRVDLLQMPADDGDTLDDTLADVGAGPRAKRPESEPAPPPPPARSLQHTPQRGSGIASAPPAARKRTTDVPPLSSRKPASIPPIGVEVKRAPTQPPPVATRKPATIPPISAEPMRTPSDPPAISAAPAAATKPSETKRSPTNPPPTPPARRAPTAPPVPVTSAASIETVDPAAVVQLPPPRPRKPDHPDVGALIASPLERASGDLPLGTFTYPTQRRGNRLLWMLALLAAGALGFVAVVYLFPRASSPSAAPKPPEETAVSAATIDAAAAEPAPPPPEEPDIVIEPGPKAPPRPTPAPPPSPASAARPSPGTASSARPQPGGGAVTRPSPPQGSGAGSQAALGEPEEEQEPPPSPPVASSDCDEVACVLTKYDRPCCEKFRPAESDIKPRAGGIPSELDKAAVRAGVEKIKPRVVACGEQHRDRGTVRIAVQVRPDGTVSEASVAASPGDALGACVAGAMRKALFSKSVNGGSFTYPFVF